VEKSSRASLENIRDRLDAAPIEHSRRHALALSLPVPFRLAPVDQSPRLEASHCENACWRANIMRFLFVASLRS
jgi:hypothetical protein